MFLHVMEPSYVCEKLGFCRNVSPNLYSGGISLVLFLMYIKTKIIINLNVSNFTLSTKCSVYRTLRTQGNYVRTVARSLRT